MMDLRYLKLGLACLMSVTVACFEEGVEGAEDTGGGSDDVGLSFTVTGPDDVVWIGVYDRPTATNAPAGEVGSGYVAYTLSGVGSAQAKKRATIERVHVGDWNQYRQRVAAHVLPSLLEESVSCAGGCGEGEFCIRQTCSDQHSLLLLQGEDTEVEGRLQQVFPSTLAGMDVVLIADTTLSASEVASAETAAERFASELGNVAELLGLSADSGVTDFNEDGRLFVVVTDQTVGPLGADTIGWFNPHDSSTQSDSNGADILWLRPGGTDALNQQVGTLIHEYFHLALFSKRASSGQTEPETLWLDEAMAHAFEDLSGWGSSNVVTTEEGLLSFSETALSSGDDSLAQRGVGYTFIRYLIDEHARGRGITAADDPRVVESVEWFYSQILSSSSRGWNHSVLSSLPDASISGWLSAVLGVPGGYLTVGESASEQAIGFDPFGQYPSADGFDVYLEGPQFEDLGALDGAYEGFVAESGWNILQLSGMDPGTYAPVLEMTSGRDGVLVVVPGGGR